MVRPYFIFKNTNSIGYAIYVSEMPPEQLNEDEFEFVEIPGRDGHLSINKGRKESINKLIKGTFFNSNNRMAILSWLKGTGRLTLSTEPDVYYKAQIVKPVQYVGTFRGGRKFEVSFLCQPYAYVLNGDDVIILTTVPTTITNAESEISKPLIKIFGSGAVDLIINSKIHKFNINEYVTVDSELMECYKDNTLATFTGDFPELSPGENNITWTGTVTKIEVIPRWRR